jgi:hypothetical protein
MRTQSRIKNSFAERRLFAIRTLVSVVVIVLLSAGLILRMMWLQVINHDYYITRSDDNRMPDPGRVYNVCDDEPAAAAEVTAYACNLLGVEPPPLIPLEEAEMSPMALSFWQDNRLVSNRRLHEELGVTLAYPNYRAGLEAILAAGG